MEILSKIWDYCVENLGDVAAIISAIITVLVYRKTVKRERKQMTIKDFSMLREKYPNKLCSQEEKKKYLKDMEFFCTGLNEGIYDIGIVEKMSGSLLLKQYDRDMKGFIEERRKTGTASDKAWIEYETVIKKIYCIRNCRFICPLCSLIKKFR